MQDNDPTLSHSENTMTVYVLRSKTNSNKYYSSFAFVNTVLSESTDKHTVIDMVDNPIDAAKFFVSGAADKFAREHGFDEFEEIAIKFGWDLAE